ncbi:MAG: hypothetical protein NC328_01730, partial [Muribaculum sp.]|nr:hypothetical protein [Muribaculum sp.]
QRSRRIYVGLYHRGLQPCLTCNDGDCRKMIVSPRLHIVGNAAIRCPASQPKTKPTSQKRTV